MKYEIKQYKGQTIEYDDDLDKFVCDITIEDRNKTSKRGSLKDLEKEIDQFIKQNLEFKPFKLIEVKSYGGFTVVDVEGIRTDGLFKCTSKSGISGRRTDLINFEKKIRNGDEFFYYDPEIIKEKKAIEKEYEEARTLSGKKEAALLKKAKKFDVNDIKRYVDAFTKS